MKVFFVRPSPQLQEKENLVLGVFFSFLLALSLRGGGRTSTLIKRLLLSTLGTFKRLAACVL